MNRSAKLLGVSTPSVMTWIEQFAEAYAQKPEPEGRAVVVELDEMWHFLGRKRARGSGPGFIPGGSDDLRWAAKKRLNSRWLLGSAVLQRGARFSRHLA